MAGHIWLTDLAAAAAKSGLDVVEVPGWRTRSAAPNGGRYGGPGMDGVKGLMIHHTATPETYRPDLDYPTYNVILQGNGSTGGPLSQLGLCRCGNHVYVFAAGICWHAGQVRDYSTQGNRVCIGIEAEHSGNPRDPWPPARYEGYVKLAAAIAGHYNIPTTAIVGHKEASTTGKIDPLFDMKIFRRKVAAARFTPPPTPEGELTMSDVNKILARLDAQDKELATLRRQVHEIRYNSRKVTLSEADRATLGTPLTTITPAGLAKVAALNAATARRLVAASTPEQREHITAEADRVIAAVTDAEED